MKRFSRLVALSTLSAVLCTGVTFAQDNRGPQNNDPRNNGHDQQNNGRDQQNNGDHHDQGNSSNHDNHQYVHHNDWKKGHRMQQQDWNRGEAVDYRSYHLRTPPRGYEWREVDGNYVLAVVATGLIASIIMAAAASH